MSISQLSQYLLYLLGPKRKYEERVAKAIDRAVKKLCADRGYAARMDDFLNAYGIRGRYRKAIKLRSFKIPDVERLAQCLRRIKMPSEMIVDFEQRFVPWDSWAPGARAVAVLGERNVVTRDAPGGIRSKVLGARDGEALGRLGRILQTKAEVDYDADRESVPSDLDRRAAEAHLDDLCKKTPGGAVIVIGSPLRNPIADPIARRIMRDDSPEDLPARFRWHFPFQKKDHYLVEPAVCLPSEAGIRQRGHGATTFPRTTDEHIMKEAGARGALGTGERLGPYDDAGMVLMDCAHDPVLILCAGHGGSATVAAVLALGETMYTERCLTAENDGLGYGRMFQVVTTDLYKHTVEDIDDFCFNDTYGAGWRYPWAEENSR